MSRVTIRRVLVALIFACAVAPLRADTIDVTEAMMESQGLQAIPIGANLGADEHSTLSLSRAYTRSSRRSATLSRPDKPIWA